MSKAIIAIDKSKSYRVYLTITTEMVEEARKIHETTPLATAGLGRVLTAAGLMGIMMKNHKDKLTIQFKGDGPAKAILATALGDGSVKGYISNPDVDLPLTKDGKLDVGRSLGIGDLTVIRDFGLKEPYLGTIALVSGEIADDLAAYFFISEQQNSSVALGVKVERDYSVGAAGGMIIQMLPGGEEGAVDALEELIGKMDPLTTIIDRVLKKSKGKTEAGIVEDLLREIFKSMPEEFGVEKIGEGEIKLTCDCCEDRLEQVLATVGKEELQAMIDEDGQAEMQCQFCLKKYCFGRERLQKILEEIS
ncbi:MAG: Hsp33 family molecular chaperone HslO [Anaerovoracaceae bacterium]